MKNKKSLVMLLAIMLVLLVAVGVLAACNPTEGDAATKYTVTFDLGDYSEGVAPAPKTVEAGQSIVLEEVTRPEYEFDGWYDGEKLYKAGTSYVVNGDVTLTAQWSKEDTYYTVTFDLGEYTDGTAPASKTVKGVTEIQMPDPGEWPGHVFDGWYDGEKLYEVDADYVVKGDVTLTAQWSPEGTYYTVTFNLGSYTGGVAPAPKTVEAGQSIILEYVERPEYEFDGWYDGEKLYKAGTSYVVNDNVTLIAQWSKEDTYYTVTFDLGDYTGGTAPAAKTVKGVTEIQMPDPGEWPGHIFDGWYMKGAEQNKYDVGASYVVNASVTFYASWRDNGFIREEYRGDYQVGVVYMGGFLGIEEFWHITADTIYYQGREVTDLKELEDGGYSFTAHYWNTFGIADEDTDPDEKHVGDDGITYEVWDMSFPAEMYFAYVEEYDAEMLIVQSLVPKGEGELYDPDVLEKIDGFTLEFQGAGADGTNAYVEVDENYHPVLSQIPDFNAAGFIGWYTTANMDDQFLPGIKFDPTKEYYQNMIFEPKYDYVGTYTNTETGDTIRLDPDDDGYWIFMKTAGGYEQQIGSFQYDPSNKQVYVYNYDGKLIYIFQLNTSERTYTDITPDFELAEGMVGEWYGLFLEGSSDEQSKYYAFSIEEDGDYVITSWIPGREGVKQNSTSRFDTTADGYIVLRVDGQTVYVKLNDDGTLGIEIRHSEYNIFTASLLKKNTIKGSWTSASTTLVFGDEGVLTCDGVTGEYSNLYSNNYRATLGGETLSIEISEFGEMTVTSDSDSSMYRGYYMPGANAYTRPEYVKDALEGQFYGYYDEQYMYRFDFDGLGRVKPYYWDIIPTSPYKGDTKSYTIDEDNHVTFSLYDVDFEGTLSADGKILTVTGDGTTYVLVTQDAIVGTHTIDDQQYVFTNDSVTIGGDSVEYTFELKKLSSETKDASWMAEHNNKEYHFYFTEDGFAATIIDLEKDDSGSFPSELKGSWEGATDSEGCSYVFTFNADKTGYVEYDDGSDKGSYEITIRVNKKGVISFFNKANDSKIGTVTINSGDPITINVVFYDDVYNNLTAVAPKVVPAKDLYPGTWEVNDGDGDYTIVIKSDGTGSAAYEGDYSYGSYDDFSTSITWTYNATDGSISFNADSSTFKMLFEGDECYLTRGESKYGPMEKTAEEVSDIKQESYYGTWTVSDGDGDYTIEIKEGGTGSAAYEGEYYYFDNFSTSITWTYDSKEGSISFNADDSTFKMLFEGDKCYLTRGDDNKFPTAMTKTGGGVDTPPTKEHEDEWYHNVLKGSWNGIDHTDEWTYYLEFDGAGMVTVSYGDPVTDPEVLGSAKYTINDDGTITFKVLTYSFTITVVDETHIDVVMDRQTYNGVEKKAAAVDYQALLKGTWGTLTDSEDYWVTYTFTFDGAGKVTITCDDMGDEFSDTVEYTVTAEGAISFTTTLGYIGDVTGTITADGKLTLNVWDEDYTNLKKK